MTFKRILLTLSVFAATPAVHAMRYTRPIFLARSLQQCGMPALTAEFNRHYPPTANTLACAKPEYAAPFAAIGCAGAALLATIAQEDSPDESAPEYASIENLSVSDVHGLAHALEHAHPSDQTELARTIAQNITSYKTTQLITLLQSAPDRPRLIVAKAIAQKITNYSTREIYALLKADRSEQTHLALANALKNNYTYFTQRSFMGVKLYSSTEWRANYLQMISGLKFAQQRIALEPVLKDIHQYNIFSVLAHTDTFLAKSILTAFTASPHVRVQDYGNGRDLFRLLEITKPYNQTNIAHSLAQHINQFNEWHFYAFIKHCNEPAKDVICKAIAKDIRCNPAKYKNSTIEDFVRVCTPAQQTIIRAAIENEKEQRAQAQPVYYYPAMIHQEFRASKD